MTLPTSTLGVSLPKWQVEYADGSAARIGAYPCGVCWMPIEEGEQYFWSDVLNWKSHKGFFCAHVTCLQEVLINNPCTVDEEEVVRSVQKLQEIAA